MQLGDYDGAMAIAAAWVDGLRPDPSLTVSAWADRHRVMSPRGANDRVPADWVPLVFDLSRLVHDPLDAARMPDKGAVRPAQEIALPGITLVMLKDWAADASDTAEGTKRRLRQRFARAGASAKRLLRRP
jgi:hypothetical protein